MSFYLPFTKIEQSVEMTVAPGATILAEGLALVRTNTAQSAGVLPSTGNASDVFQGFSWAGTSAVPFSESMYNSVETYTVVGGAVTLNMTPIAGQVFVYDNTAGAAVASPTVTNATVSGLTTGNSVTVTYKYTLSVQQARALFGDIQPGGYVGAYVGQIGVITRGVVYTSEFDASGNWAATTGIWMQASGQITTTANKGVNSVQIPGSVIAIPGQSQPFLGISFAAAGA